MSKLQLADQSAVTVDGRPMVIDNLALNLPEGWNGKAELTYTDEEGAAHQISFHGIKPMLGRLKERFAVDRLAKLIGLAGRSPEKKRRR